MAKIAIVSNRENAAISHVLKPVAQALGVDMHYYPFPELDIEAYDLIHLGYLGLLEREDLQRSAITSLNVWNIAIERISAWMNDGWISAYDHYVVDDTTTFQLLGQMGSSDISLIPLAFDPSTFAPLPVPDVAFTVGTFCNAYPSKRWEIVHAACEIAKVRCFCQVLDPNRTHYSIDPVRDAYSHMHVFAHTSYTDTNSMPAHEALLCGLPVLSTHNFGIHRVLQEGVNGHFHNGSAADLAEKILLAKENYTHLRKGALATPLPLLKEAINGYSKLFSKLLDGEPVPIVRPEIADTCLKVRGLRTDGSISPGRGKTRVWSS